MILKKTSFKLMNNAVSGKTIENVRKHRYIKLVTTKRGRNYVVSEPNYVKPKYGKNQNCVIWIQIVSLYT